MKFGTVFIFLSLLATASGIFSATRRQLKKEKKKKEKNNGLKMGKKHPNILFIMVDEQRFPTSYDNEKLGDWFIKNLPTQTAMKRKSTELVSHYAASTACAPSRAALFTGQYPTLSGVAYTPGGAKLQNENLMYHLDFNTVPTMGDYFTEAGYRSLYRGKWHIGHAEIEVPINREIIRSSDSNGNVIAKNRDLYLHSQRLREYGFKDNIGPDPEGPEQGNAGVNRDPLVADQAIESLDMLEASNDDTPFLLVASFLNPHDIVLFGALWLSFGYDYEQAKKVVPTYGFPPSVDEDLVAGKKPACQADYINKYGKIFLPQVQVPVYYQFYFYLQKLVDFQVGRVWNRLQESKFKDNTIVVFTSDHGDALGSHGGMHQKWHQAYEETTHVPFMISGPGIGKGKKIDILSSHIDILPTLLSLTNLNESKLRRRLKQVHTEAQSLPGRDLEDVIKGVDRKDLPVYFLTEDDVSVGTNQFSAITELPYKSVIDPSNVEAVIVRIDGVLWKYVRTFKNSLINPPTDDTPESEEFELYNLLNDPIEVINLGYDNIGTTEEARLVMPYLQQLLIELRAEKLKHPTNLDVSI